MIFKGAYIKNAGKFTHSFTKEANRFYHSVVPIPSVPLSLHEPDSHVLVPEDSSPMAALVPDMNELTYDNIVNRSLKYRQNLMIKLNELRVGSQRIYFRLAEKDFSSLSDQALQTAKEARMKYFRNYFLISGFGVFSLDKLILPFDKIKDQLKVSSIKLSEKIPLDVAKEKWSVLKDKLPGWQITLADKLQVVQDLVNKKLIKEKKTDGEECKP